MEIATVARPYAEALFQIAQKQGLDTWSEQMEMMANVGSHPDVLALTDSPTLSKSSIAQVLHAVCKCENNEPVKNFLNVLVENGRVPLLPEIARQFEELKNASTGTAFVKIVSAYPIDDALTRQITEKLEKRFGTRLIPEVEVDPTLIGGVIASVGDEVIDLSVRGRLQQMQDTLVS